MSRISLTLSFLAPALLATLAAAQVDPAKTGESAGMSAQRLGRIGPALRSEIDRGAFPGTVTLVARNGTVVHFEANGYSDAAKSKPMTVDAIFRLASMTKPFVTAAGMMLVEQGAMGLQDPIAKWLPELKDLKVETRGGDIPPQRAVTVHDLMRHTAGFVYARNARSARIKKMVEELNIESLESDITSEEMLKRLGTIPLASQPGSVWEYSIATDVLGLLLERVAGKTLDVILRELLFDPLGMVDTQWWLDAEKRSRLADSLDNFPQKATALKGYRQFENPVGKSYLKGGAGLVGTAQDYLKFVQMMVNGGEYAGKRYLSKESVDLMLSDQTPGISGNLTSFLPDHGFGFGFAVRLRDGFGSGPGSKGDAMWFGAMGTSFWIDPKQGLVGIFMAQGVPSARIRTLFKGLVYDALVQ